MLIDFHNQSEKVFQCMNNGKGKISAKMFVNQSGKVIISSLEPRASIGSHVHNTSNDINFVVSGKGLAICDGHREILEPGDCHYCPKGSSHEIINTGDEDLILYTVVQEL